jgi:hypothetical protein
MVLDKIRSLLKRGGSEECGKGVERQPTQSVNVYETALSDLRSGLLDGNYALIVWDKVCDDPGMKPDLLNVVAVIDGGFLVYTGIKEGKVFSIQLMSGSARGFLTVYIVTRSFLDKLIKRFESSNKRMGVDPEEVAVIHVLSPEILKKFYEIESSTCLVVPAPRSLAENLINEVVNEIEKRLRSVAEASKQVGLPQPEAGGK